MNDNKRSSLLDVSELIYFNNMVKPDYYKIKLKKLDNIFDVEAIDVIEALELNFCLGNALKYLWRAGKKQGEAKEKDLKKALFYIQRELENDKTR